MKDCVCSLHLPWIVGLHVYEAGDRDYYSPIAIITDPIIEREEKLQTKKNVFPISEAVLGAPVLHAWVQV